MFDRVRVAAVLAAVVVCGFTGPGAISEERPGPKGSVVLTVAGKAANWNRGAMVPARDTLMNHHNIRFERAMTFDLETLASLPQDELRVVTPAGDGTFKGPRLEDVLKASGAQDSSIRLVSLDGSATELSPEEVKAKNWILTLAVDSKPVGIGDFGPLWLMHRPVSGSTPSQEEIERWVWSVFYIEVL